MINTNILEDDAEELMPQVMVETEATLAQVISSKEGMVTQAFHLWLTTNILEIFKAHKPTEVMYEKCMRVAHAEGLQNSGMGTF